MVPDGRGAGASIPGAVDRRRVLRALAVGAAGAATASTWVEALTALAHQEAHARAAQAVAAAADWNPRVLTAPQNELVTAITEHIIPETDTPGARGALVNRFVDHVLATAAPHVRREFLDGLAWMDERSRVLFGTPFLEASNDRQAELLTRLSSEGNPHEEAGIGRDFFRTIKVMTIDGYYTTEVGLRQELGDPGELFLMKFPGCDHPEHQK